jgi:Skp family chaperone for outer membrane proteins
VAEREVRDILREIRERVRSGESMTVERPAARAESSGPDEALARLGSHLEIAARAHDRLPPLTSRREGFAARLELWLKRKLSRAAHWFTFEQVNFNRATVASLEETAAALAFQLDQSRELSAELKEMRAELARLRRELDRRVDLLAADGRAGRERLQEEHRVSFKQLLLELQETSLRAERSERVIKERLESLALKLERLGRELESSRGLEEQQVRR